MGKIEFTYTDLIDSDIKIKQYRRSFHDCKIVMKIKKCDYDELIDTGLLDKMSLDDLLNCELEVM